MAYVKDKARPQSIVDRRLTATGDSWTRLVDVDTGVDTVFSPPLQAIVSYSPTGTIDVINSNGDAVTIDVASHEDDIEMEIREILSTSDATGVVGAS